MAAQPHTHDDSAPLTAGLMTTPQAARYLGVSAAFLERDRITLQTIPFVRLGSRAIRYRWEDLDAHLEAMRVGGASA